MRKEMTAPRMCAYASTPGGCLMQQRDGTCRFVHSRNELNAHPMYRTSKCFDVNCPGDYACGRYHRESDRRRPPATALGPRAPTIPIMCSNMSQTGGAVCLKASACAFCHTRAEFLKIYKTLPCRKFHAGVRCPLGKDCGYYHDVAERRTTASEQHEEESEEEEYDDEEYGGEEKAARDEAVAPIAEYSDEPFSYFAYKLFERR